MTLLIGTEACRGSDQQGHSDSGKEIRVVFCDISKAFDRVWH